MAYVVREVLIKGRLTWILYHLKRHYKQTQKKIHKRRLKKTL